MKKIVYIFSLLYSFCCFGINNVEDEQSNKEKIMGYTINENLENVTPEPGQQANVDIVQWAGLPYSDRQVFVEDTIVNSGTRSLKLNPSRNHSGGEYTNTEVTFRPDNYTNIVGGDEAWARMMVYIPSGFDWRTGSNGGSISTEPKFMRVFYRTDSYSNSAFKICKRTNSGGDSRWALGFGYSGDWRSSRNIQGSVQEVFQNGINDVYKAPFDNDYALYKIPSDEWSVLESYVYFSTNGIIRVWLNEVLLYEFRTDTLSKEAGRSPPGGTPSMQAFSTWGGLPYKSDDNFLYVDDFLFTTDSSYATKTDDRGNKIIGRAEGNSNGGNGGNGGDDPLTIFNHKVVTGETTATISWETNKDSNTIVDYGPTEDRGTFARGDENTKEHVVELNDLEVNTKYYYRFSSRVEETGETVMDPENSTFTTKESTQPTKLFLDDLEDVSASSPVKNQILIYDGSKWVNQGIDFNSLIEEKVVEILGRTDLVVRET